MAYHTGKAFGASALIGSLSTLFFFGSSSSKKEADSTNKIETTKPVMTQTKSLKFASGVCVIPHDEKRFKGGEDAWCANDKLISVADGVGGWADHGVDPGLFSEQLCQNIMEEFKKDPTVSLKKILIESVKKTTETGSATACLASLDNSEETV